MAGRVLLVCALCVLCCGGGGGVGAWGGGYCTESDWRDLRAVAREMAEAEIEGQYCSRKPEFVKRLRASLQAGAERVVSGTVEGDNPTGNGVDGKEGVAANSGHPQRVDDDVKSCEGENGVSGGKNCSVGIEGREETPDGKQQPGKTPVTLPSPVQLPSQPQSQEQPSEQAVVITTVVHSNGAAGSSHIASDTSVGSAAQTPQTVLPADGSGAAAGAPPSSDSAAPSAAAAGPPAKDASNTASMTETGSSPAVQSRPSSPMTTNEAGQAEQNHTEVSTSHEQPEASGGGDNQASKPAAGAAAQAVNSTTKTMVAPVDSDGSTAASHCTSPLALLLLACAAAAAMAAA
ncbi:hypothetical protein TraAM80_10582 [Trypanosoma rangeli]|uniref:Mucin-associated surface protein (MASP) n=1 Tax=Trypanosoma rangeli TaxID=5698 RepID=A0A422MNP4_TRYRA|nr:uncharacterized protein TraAM80_10582 [Trypanosoma rangeli]RNE94803.1 hypothetical protein TraAM80_10582 [Trypanosoma rangeli]|eukprot:RNE94803.1 hypothetical protein TraAM80_10582 [Trypanosoma rangeli]